MSEYTIDELAAATKVPSRTIRFYQSKGALPRPEIKGRVAFYGEPHVERLKLIASLQDRGLRIDAIRDLVARIDKGEVDVAEWLGLETQLKAPWANDQPRVATEAELFELAGTKRPEILRKHMGRAASDLVDLIMKSSDEIFASRGDGADAGETMREPRPMALEAARLIFAQEMERALRKLLESGKATKLRTRPKKR